MGTYRYILAVMVVLSHGLVMWFGYNIGVVAVVSFFCISGFVMSGLISKHYATLKRLPWFYFDRLLRIFPQYIVYMLAASWLYYTGRVVSQDFLTGVTMLTSFLNALIVPLGYPSSFGVDLSNAVFIPQAWSLGLELTFYAIAPVVVLYANRSVTRLVAFCSCLVALAALFGYIDTSMYGYRTLPGTLFLFILGMEMHRRRDPLLRWALTGFLFVGWVAVVMTPSLDIHWTKEVFLGGLIASAVVPAVARIRYAQPGQTSTSGIVLERLGRFDNDLGFVSYGVFLNHFIFIWLLRTHTALGQFNTLELDHLLIVTASSTAAAWATYKCIDAPIATLRKALRLRRETAAGGLARSQGELGEVKS